MNAKGLVLLLKTDDDERWGEAFAQRCPEIEIRIWPQVGDASQIDYALLWAPPEQLFTGLTNLRVIFSIGAGVDGIIKVKNLPAQIPLVRLSDPLLIQAMVEYVCYSVLRAQLGMPAYEQQQKARCWQVNSPVFAKQCKVGVMGLGQLGKPVALMLQQLGFKVLGYSRRLKALPGIACFDETSFDEFLAQTNILVCLLPLTEQTKQILSKPLFDRLPDAAVIVNVGRGGHLNQKDLLKALDSGKLSHAVLDVFEPEPLPAGHPFWLDSRITITPHIASQTIPESAIDHIIEGIRQDQNSETLKFLYQPGLGY